MLQLITMVEVYKYRNITWLDLENPTKDEVRSLINSHGINPLVADELLTPTSRSKVDKYPNYIYLILHFPATYNVDESLRKPKEVQEIDFIIGKDFIITTHYNQLDALQEFSKIFEVNSILNRDGMGDHAGYIFFYMIENFYKEIMDRIENIKGLLVDIENDIFEGKEKEMVFALSRINRLLLTYKESMLLHQEVLESFEITGQEFFGEKFKYHLRKILGEYYKVHSALESLKEYLHELRDTNDSLLSTKQNEVMKTLTSVTFILLPLSLIASTFGMNSTNMPVVSSENGFYIIISIMACSALSLFIYLKFKKWL